MTRQQLGSIVAMPPDRYGAERWRLFAPVGKRRITKVFRGTHREAQRELARLVSAGHPQNAPAALTLGDWARQYLAMRERELSPRTFVKYRTTIRHHIIPRLGRERLKDLTPRRVSAWLDMLQHDGVGRNSTQQAYGLLRMVLQEAVFHGHLPANPAAAVRRPSVPHAISTALPLEEAQRVMGLLDSEDMMHRCAYALALTTGLRRGELTALRWSDIDEFAGNLHVRRSVVIIAGERLVKEVKTRAGVRTVPLTPGVAAILRSWHGQCPAHPDGYVFVWPDGAWVHLDYFTRAWRWFRERHGLAGVRFHDLRHTAASIMLSEGMAVTEVAAVLGQRPETTIRTYAHVIRNASERARVVMDGVFSSPTAHETAQSCAIIAESPREPEGVAPRAEGAG